MSSRQSRMAIWDMINTRFLTLQLWNLHLLLSFSTRRHTSMAFRAILSNFVKNSELKTTYNTFRDCRRHFFREPFSKKLYTTQIPGWLFHWNTLIRLLLHFVFLELFLLITSLCFFSVRAMNTISSPLGRKFS